MAKQPTINTISTDVAGLDGPLNENFSNVQDSFDNTISRDGSTPNTMLSDFDLNGYDLLNGSVLYSDEIVVDGVNLTDQVAAAAASAAAALVSEGNASNSADAAASSASSAASSAAAAQAVEDQLPDWQGGWVTATAYALGDLVYESGSTYICVVAHTSGTFATDLAAVKWEIFAQQGGAGGGTGDLLAANNLSDVANAGVARTNLGLAIGTNVQAYDSELQKVITASSLEQGIDIAGLTAKTTTTTPNLDYLMMYDGTDNKKISATYLLNYIGNTSAGLSEGPDTNDYIGVYDSSASTTKRNTYANFLSGINNLTEDSSPDLSADFILAYDTSAGAAKKVSPSNLASGNTNVLVVTDQKADGTQGGPSVSGAWTARTLNTEQYNGISGSSLGSNQVTLPSGTYFVRAHAPLGQGGVMRFKIRLQNITDGTTTVMGASSYNGGSGSSITHSFIEGYFTIAASKTFELQYWTNTVATQGLGVATSVGDGSVEIYSQIIFEKLA